MHAPIERLQRVAIEIPHEIEQFQRLKLDSKKKKTMHELLRTKEAELLRDTNSVFFVQDENTKQRLSELSAQAEKLNDACSNVESLHKKTASTTIGSLNLPLTTLLEALETSRRALDREAEFEMFEETNGSQSSGDIQGVRFHLCNNQGIQRSIGCIEVTHVDTLHPGVILVGTPETTADELEKVKADIDLRSSSTTKISKPRNFEREKEKLVVTPKYLDLESNGKPDQTLPNTEKKKKINIQAVIPYKNDGENEGIIHYRGTKGGLQAFSNPALFPPDDEYLVVLRANSCIEGDLTMLVGCRHFDGVFFETDSSLGNWVSIELRGGLLMPTHYSLGYYITGKDHIPRNWVFQGSLDNVTFINLKMHQMDNSLDADIHLATWSIGEKEKEKGPFRYFRILQTGPTSSGSLFLVLSFIELYGILFENP